MSDHEKASIRNGTEASQSTEGLDAFMQRALSKSSVIPLTLVNVTLVLIGYLFSI